jgi:hypothetical protein
VSFIRRHELALLVSIMGCGVDCLHEAVPEFISGIEELEHKSGRSLASTWTRQSGNPCSKGKGKTNTLQIHVWSKRNW